MTSDRAVIRKVLYRIIPFTMLLFFIGYIDRTNIGIAALQMNQSLGFTAQTYGLGAGIFFVGYALFEIPSNWAMLRVGARVWLARIMITWGVISTGMAFINGETAFYTLRFLLGVAEAGFLPGVMYYFSTWIPARQRGKAMSLFMSAATVSLFVGTPLGGMFLSLQGFFGLQGWQTLFLIEGIPAILIGIVTLYYLTDTPAGANWLSPQEKLVLKEVLDQEEKLNPAAKMSFAQALVKPVVLGMAALAFFMNFSNYAVVFWLPQIVKEFGRMSNTQTAWVSAFPYLLACASMLLNGWHSDKTGDRKWHLVLCALAGFVGLLISAFAGNSVLVFSGLCVAAIGIWGMFGVFWALAGDHLSGAAAAAGFAMINTIANLGGFVGPYLMGVVRQHSSNFSASLLMLSVGPLLAIVLAAIFGSARTQRPVASTTI